jgi:hypothetical protein
MARLLSRYNDAIRQRAVIDAWDSSTNTISPISYLEYVGFSGAAATFAQNTSYPIYTAPNDGKTWKVVGISYRFTTQSTSASTFSLEVAGAGVAPGSGTAQTGALSLQGTANTTINGTLTASTTVSAGTSINLVVSNTAATTGLAGLVITVSLQRLT